VVLVAQMERPGLSASEKAELWKAGRRGRRLATLVVLLANTLVKRQGLLSLNGERHCRATAISHLFNSARARRDLARDCCRTVYLKYSPHSWPFTFNRKLRDSPSSMSPKVTCICSRSGRLGPYLSSKILSACHKRLTTKDCCVETKAGLGPGQVARWLKVQYSNDTGMRMSH
jgi:hypothetical protein